MSMDLEKEYQTKFNTYSLTTVKHSSGLIIFIVTLKVEYFFVSRNTKICVCTGAVYQNVIKICIYVRMFVEDGKIVEKKSVQTFSPAFRRPLIIFFI